MPAKISVALCTFNGERYLAELLESLASQSRLPDELIVRDDRSTDATVRMVNEFVARAPFPVRFEVNEANFGVVRNFERAIGDCAGDLIALCDQDDIWLKDRMRVAEEAFSTSPDIGYTFSDGELIDESSTPVGKTLWESVGFTATRREAAARGELLPLLIPYEVATGATMTFRADLRAYLLPIPQGWVHDGWIAMMSALVRPYRLLPEKLINYRVHGSQEIGVPGKPVLDNAWSKWKARFRLTVSMRETDIARQRRRMLAVRFAGAVERYRASADEYLRDAGIAPQPLAEPMITALADQARHSEIRGTLPDRRPERLSIIASEWKTGRYKRYSAGALSALQDLLY